MLGAVFRNCIPAAAALLLLTATAPAGTDDALQGEWLKYRTRFVGDDGRVRDTGNKDVSHTEGQGWAMLFAESFDDQPVFDRVWKWTHETLRRPDSALFAWRWDPHGEKPIADTNNATDGDVLIAWALVRAARRWHAHEYEAAARRIVTEIREKLIIQVGKRLVLLPGSDGCWQKDGSVIVNPSYYIYPALDEFPRLDSSAKWRRLRQDGLGLLAKARFGQWQLTPDWVTVDHSGAVTPGSPPRFGYDAIRIPLYLIWGGAATAQRLTGMMRFWDAWDGFTDKPMPAWVDVVDGRVAPYPAPSGFRAVIGLARARVRPNAPPPMPRIDDTDDYYSASLILLADLARRAVGR
jgi:endoglucanase